MVSFQRPRIIFGWSSSILILACMSAVALWKRLLDVLILETCLIPFAADVCRCNINLYIYIIIYISYLNSSCPLCAFSWSLMCFSSAHSTHSTLGNPCSHVPDFNRNWRQSKLPRHRIWLTRAILQPTWCYWWCLGADTIWHNDGWCGASLSDAWGIRRGSEISDNKPARQYSHVSAKIKAISISKHPTLSCIDTLQWTGNLDQFGRTWFGVGVANYGVTRSPPHWSSMVYCTNYSH